MDDAGPVSHPRSRISLGIITAFFVLLAASAFMPASWFGVKKQSARTSLDLSLLAEPGAYAEDVDESGDISWRELAIGGLGITPEEAEGVDIEMDKEDLDTLNDPNNLTSSFSRNMYVVSLAIQEQGGIDEESKQQITTQLMSEEAAKLVSKTYSSSDVTSLSDNSKTALKRYGNDVAAAVNGIITEDAIFGALASIDAYTNKGLKEDLAPLLEHAQAVTKAMEKLRSVKVPSSLVSQHVNLLNAYESYKDLVNNLAAIERDALRSTLAFKKYDETVRLLVRETSLMATMLKNKGVTFSKSEAGFALMAGFTQ